MRHVLMLCSVAFDAEVAPFSGNYYIFIYLLIYYFCFVNLSLGCSGAEPEVWPENSVTGIVSQVTFQSIWSNVKLHACVEVCMYGRVWVSGGPPRHCGRQRW